MFSNEPPTNTDMLKIKFRIETPQMGRDKPISKIGRDEPILFSLDLKVIHSVHEVGLVILLRMKIIMQWHPNMLTRECAPKIMPTFLQNLFH